MPDTRIDVMLDLETLGTKPNAVILSIGAVAFNPLTGRASYDEADEHLCEGFPCSPPMFYANVDIQSCLDVGLQVDGSTVKWWFSQSEGASRALKSPEPVPLPEALHGFVAWWFDTLGGKVDVRVWSHGAGFDIPILTSAFVATHRWIPFDYRYHRDTRTLFEIMDMMSNEELLANNEELKNPCPHHALYDAVCQARKVQYCFNYLGIENNGWDNG